ncbi:MAG TPA: hypothetical protein VFL91_21555 [Thermomicrobiales bacterium]|nr:hypothetical protein [Thermomicrobiales bacterium]
MTGSDGTPRVNPGYALGQLLRALGSPGETAGARATQWRRVLNGMFAGTLRPGSRTPVAGTPPWVTLEVAHGGFATGAFLAAGPLQPHEIATLRRIDRPAGVTERAALNAFFLSDRGRAELGELLQSGRYRVTVPEEAALLVTAWLIGHDEAARAEIVLKAIAPFCDRLRFYPAPAATPAPSGAGVAVQPVSAVVASLRSRRPQPAVAAMNEALRVWTPLYDRAVALFLETVEGEIPRLATSEAGQLVRRADGNPIVEGGWPCRRYPEGWAGRARSLVDEYERARATHRLSGKPEKAKENFARLRGYLVRCAADPGALTGRDVGMIRKILASYVTRHGAPGSERLAGTRAAQVRIAALPAHHDLARVLADRIAARDAGDGLPDVERCLVPLTPQEAVALGAEAGYSFPPALVAKAMRCLEAPVETLIARRLVRSSEGLALLLPRLTAQIRAGAIAEPELRRVYESVYRAFRRRRSLLLLDLQSQVHLEELPWVAAIVPWVGEGDEARHSARVALVRATRLALESFPHTILPSRLVRELRALVAAAGERIPLVDELAADIFMGSFSAPYLRAAQAAAPVIAGTIYERYYGLPLDRVLALDDLDQQRYGVPASPGLAALCAELAGAGQGDPRSVARNGTIIEQCQILSTHNVAPLISALDLLDDLRPVFSDLARRCFAWICLRQQRLSGDWRADMQTVKNCAYAWRQMILYLALADADELPRFVDWAGEHVGRQRADFRQRFAPALAGLRVVASGGGFGGDGVDRATGGRRFLGWTIGRHWLLPEPRQP